MKSSSLPRRMPNFTPKATWASRATAARTGLKTHERKVRRVVQSPLVGSSSPTACVGEQKQRSARTPAFRHLPTTSPLRRSTLRRSMQKTKRPLAARDRLLVPLWLLTPSAMSSQIMAWPPWMPWSAPLTPRRILQMPKPSFPAVACQVMGASRLPLTMLWCSTRFSIQTQPPRLRLLPVLQRRLHRASWPPTWSRAKQEHRSSMSLPR